MERLLSVSEFTAGFMSGGIIIATIFLLLWIRELGKRREKARSLAVRRPAPEPEIWVEEGRVIQSPYSVVHDYSRRW